MALFNYASKELTLKVVYYGPGLSGKTTNLQYLHSNFDPGKTGRLLSLATESDRTLFFDFLPVDLGRIKDFTVRFQLYTVPGQIRYNATRRLVLKGADAVVFVADSQRDLREHNIESFQNMRENLIENNIDPDRMPIVLQFNKRDLKTVLAIDELNRDLNTGRYEYYEAAAINGAGVEETFKAITKLLIKDFAKRYNVQFEKAGADETLIKEIKGKPEKTEMPPPVISPKPVRVELEPSELPENVRAETDKLLDAYSAEDPPGSGTREEPVMEAVPEAEKGFGAEEPWPAQEVLEPEAVSIEAAEPELRDSIAELRAELDSGIKKISDLIIEFVRAKNPHDKFQEMKAALSRLTLELESVKGALQNRKTDEAITEILKLAREMRDDRAEVLHLLREMHRELEGAGSRKRKRFGFF